MSIRMDGYERVRYSHYPWKRIGKNQRNLEIYFLIRGYVNTRPKYVKITGYIIYIEVNSANRNFKN